MLKNKIIQYCQNNPIEMYWDYNDNLSKEQIKQILSNENGLSDFEDTLYEYNLDYASNERRYFIENNLYEYWKNILYPIFLRLNQDEDTDFITSGIIDYLEDNFGDYIDFNLNTDDLLKREKDLFCLIKVYSNYDCCNSFDDPLTKDKETYLGQVFNRVKTGVKRSDFVYEFVNGAYGGSLFCFAFKTDLMNLIKLKESMNLHKRILIPKGTQFGFFSSFQGSGSLFEKVTYRNIYLNIKETGKEYSENYDYVEIIADLEQHYSIDDVYSPTNSFLESQNIKLI